MTRMSQPQTIMVGNMDSLSYPNDLFDILLVGRFRDRAITLPGLHLFTHES